MTKVLTRRFDDPESHRLDRFLASGGYGALRKALSMQPAAVIEEVKKSGLRGRGGAGFPAGMKWSFIPKNTGKPVYLCVNADESEPGTCKDRVLLERDPHALVEGILIASWAIGAEKAFIYIRGEFDLPLRRIRAAVEEARAAGYIGRNILGSPHTVDILVHRGAGAYICGEETGLLESLEGKIGRPRLKPPFPAVVGAFGCPTIINNVETLSAVPWILENGGEAYARLGTPKSPGTKLFSVSGPVKRPGIYECELGYPLKSLLEVECGGMREGKRLKAVIPGGSSVPVLPAAKVETVKLDYESMQENGSLLGSGGVIVIDDTQNMLHLLTILGRFYAHESCGQCTPCRQGTGWASRVLEKMDGRLGEAADIETLARIAKFMQGTTICFLADSLAMPIESFLRHFGAEIAAAAGAAVAS